MNLAKARPGILHRYVTPWELTGAVRARKTLLGRLAFQVEEMRAVSTTLFGQLAYRFQHRWRAPRFAEREALTPAMAERRALDQATRPPEQKFRAGDLSINAYRRTQGAAP